MSALKDHFKPKVIQIYERHKFHSRSQKAGETIAEYVAGLKNLAQTCGFGDNLNESLRDRFVTGLSSDTETQRVLLTEADLTVKRAVDIASAMEAARLDAEAMRQANVMHVGDKIQRKYKNTGDAKPQSVQGGAKPKTK